MQYAYRVDCKKYQLDCELEHSSFFYSHLQCKPEKDKVEDIFEQRRPNAKPTRKNAIYVFANESDALNFISSKDEHHLYKVIVNDEDILHKGDWKWLDIALSNKDIEYCADQYWNELPSEKPVYEWIIKKGKINEEIKISKKERLDIWAKKTGLPPL